MPRYAIICDVEKCDGCYVCFLSCKDEYIGNDYPPYSAAQSEGQSWMRVREVEYGSGNKVKVDYIPIMCQHCGDPACIKPGPEGAVYKRPDGVVMIDPVKSKGAAELVDSCPYRCISWNPELNVPQKCTMCMHLIEAGEKQPRCVEGCPTEALVFGDLDDPGSRISKLFEEKRERLEEFHPEFGTQPTVRYIRLPKPFIAGEAYCADSGECAAGAVVTLKCLATGHLRMTETNYLGCFEFRDLAENGEYEITLAMEGYLPLTLSARVKGSKNLGEIALTKA